MGAQPKHSAWSSHQGEYSDFFRNTFEAPCGIATQHANSYEAIMPRPAQGSWEATPSSGEGASSDIATHSGREGIKGSKKRRKQCVQRDMTTADHGDGNDGKACGSGMGHISTTVRSDKH
jgi:hypothetical protein